MKFLFNPGIDVPSIFSRFSNKDFRKELLKKVSINFVLENDPVIIINKDKDSSLIALKGEDFNKWFEGDIYFDPEINAFKATKDGIIFRNHDIIKIYDLFFVTKDNMEAFVIFPEFNKINYIYFKQKQKYFSDYKNNNDSVKNKKKEKNNNFDDNKEYNENKDFNEYKYYDQNKDYDEYKAYNKNVDYYNKNENINYLKLFFNDTLFINKFKKCYRKLLDNLENKNLLNFNESIIKNILSSDFKTENYLPGFFLIAKGLLPINGRCEKIIPLIEDKVLPGKLDAKDRINYFERDFLKSVKKGDTLAKILPEIPAKDGFDIFGNVIPASYDNKPFFLPGENVEKENDLLVSKIDGVISFKKNTINVYDIYKIDGDISLYTGNIHCSSTLIVTGSILENISVDVNGDLIVYGNIEKPKNLYVEGNLICKGGIIGDLNKKFIIGSSLYASFIENSFIEVKGNVIVDKEIIRSTLFVGKNILITERKGVVIGSNMHFGQHFFLKYAGTSHGSGNTMFLGHSYLAENNLKILNELLGKCENIEETEVEDKLTTKTKKIKEDLEKINIKKKILKRLLKRAKLKVYNQFSKIIVFNTLYSGNLIKGKGHRFEVVHDMESPIVFYDEFYNIVFSKISVKNIGKVKNELERFYKLKNFENSLNQEKVEIKDAKKEASRKDSKIVFKDKWGSFR